MQGNLFSGLNLSNEDKILNHLITIGTITSDECKSQLEIKHPSSIIRDLRNRGYIIDSEPKYGIKNDRRTYWVQYKLAPPQLQCAKINNLIEKFRTLTVDVVTA